MKIFIFGRNGMLGNHVYSYFKSNTSYDVVGITRKDIDLSCVSNFEMLDGWFSPEDVVINCVGVIKQRNNADGLDFIVVNSVLPHYLSNACKDIRAKFINISTDCVFTGMDGGYNEESTHDALDVYGRTKSLGEPANATTIRTSIIGEELSNFCSLVEWVKSNKNKSVLGYTNHFWNGITCLQFAKICEYMIDNSFYWEGVRHITSPSVISKCDLVKLISKIYDLNIDVTPHIAPASCDRSLSSIKERFPLDIPELDIQIKEQKVFYER